jgi:hypothetical protein
VLRIAHAAIELRDGRLRVTPRTFERHYTDFADYRGYLLKTLRGMFENGASRQRRAALRPIASVSSGYDSNAGAALAAALGCQQALTLRNARNGHADSGQSVGEALGLEVLEFERPSEGAKVAAHDEAEFVATGMGGEDIALAAFEPALRGRILLTGFHGDKVWDPELRPNAVLARGDLSGSSLAEFRLRVGFVHVPVPFIGALRHDEVRQVGLSEEMAPWRIGTSYDRPIPRRVLEEVGVPRGLFGQTKKAASMLIFQKASIFSRPTQLELQEFAWSRGETSARWAQRKWWARYRFWCGARKAARAVTARPLPRWMEHIVLGDDWRVFEHSSPLASELAFRWALRRIRARYRFGQANPTSGASG